MDPTYQQARNDIARAIPRGGRPGVWSPGHRHTRCCPHRVLQKHDPQTAQTPRDHAIPQLPSSDPPTLFRPGLNRLPELTHTSMPTTVAEKRTPTSIILPEPTNFMSYHVTLESPKESLSEINASSSTQERETNETGDAELGSG